MASQSSPFEGMLVPPQGLTEPPLPPSEQPLQCPRCDSTNTKFCYYNNYSLSQPRHFCKSCRRYWTKGGTLRNIPVGGGCRKYKKLTSRKATRFSSQIFAVNSALADLAAAGLTSGLVDLSLQSGEGQGHFPAVAHCGGFFGLIGSPGGGIFLQTPENHGFGENLGCDNVGDGGGGNVGPYEESAAKIESFSAGGGRGSQQVSTDIEVGSGSSSEGWAGLDTPTLHLDNNNVEVFF